MSAHLKSYNTTTGYRAKAKGLSHKLKTCPEPIASGSAVLGKKNSLERGPEEPLDSTLEKVTSPVRVKEEAAGLSTPVKVRKKDQGYRNNKKSRFGGNTKRQGLEGDPVMMMRANYHRGYMSVGRKSSDDYTDKFKIAHPEPRERGKTKITQNLGETAIDGGNEDVARECQWGGRRKRRL